MEAFQHLEEFMAEAKKDAQEFYEKGNQLAGTRLRQKMLQVRSSSNLVRADVTDKKNERKKKK